MINKRYATFFLFTFLSFYSAFLFSSQRIKDCFLGATFGCAIGDAMGRPTEFMNIKQIFSTYPNGIKSFEDFRKKDFFIDSNGNKFAPYTDDTAMAKLVMQTLIESKKSNWDLNKTMSEIAKSFVKDMDSSNGWAASHRAPGNTCWAGVKTLKHRLYVGIEQWGDRWWDINKINGRGCGSVMRAFPFGLLFADDVDKAEKWAVEHSKLSHGASISLAACAAMAVGVSLSVQKKNIYYIVEKMEEAARRYDDETANMIHDAILLGKEHYNVLSSSGCIDLLQAHDYSKIVFEKYLGWVAHDAIAASIYACIVGQNSIQDAIFLGVHTPGDSDSIACMAGALVGARLGVKSYILKEWMTIIEGSEELAELSKEGAKLISALPN